MLGIRGYINDLKKTHGFYSNILITLSLLKRKEKLKLILVSVLQILAGLLDLIGVIIVGGLGALAVQGIESKSPGNKVNSLLKFMHLENLSFQRQIAVLALTSTIVIVLKVFISIYLNRKTLHFLSLKASQISTNIFSKFIQQEITFVQSHTTQEIQFIISEGLQTIFVKILGALIILLSDIAMLVVLVVGLFYVDQSLTLLIVGMFLTVAFGLYKFLHERVHALSFALAKLSIQNLENISEALHSYREITIHNQKHYYVNRLKKNSEEISKKSAELNFQPYISKYILEIFTLTGFLVLSAYEFSTKSAVHAVAGMAVFLAASSRIAPGILRIQQNILQIKGSMGGSSNTFDLLSQLRSRIEKQFTSSKPDFQYIGFQGNVKLDSINFNYEKNDFNLNNLSLEIENGSSVAIVGPSGAGKTTLIDLILGMLKPEKGEILISGLPPEAAIYKWPGSISYVPQNIFIASGSVRHNVGLGFDENLITEDRIWKALEFAQLRKTIEMLPNGLDTLIGDGGMQLSGGQRQRIGLARAIFTSPKLLVLDEATSSLDSETEFLITKSISTLKNNTTILIIAHRLSTVKDADKVVYMADGKILSVGTFEEVRTKVPEFDNQAQILGL